VVTVSEQVADGNGYSALAVELARLRAENARLLRLLKLTRQEAAPPGPWQSGLFEAPPGEVPRTFRAANPLTLTRKGAAPQTAVLAVASFERTSISGAFGSCG
jgi:hypothetical protein